MERPERIWKTGEAVQIRYGRERRVVPGASESQRMGMPPAQPPRIASKLRKSDFPLPDASVTVRAFRDLMRGEIVRLAPLEDVPS